MQIGSQQASPLETILNDTSSSSPKDKLEFLSNIIMSESEIIPNTNSSSL